MTPRRHRSASNASSNPQRIESPSNFMQQSKRQLGMTPAIYENNMKVLHRREPSILSIFDQFSHVCVYHHNGSKWEKQGYEGSMFLFEKQTYPPYGFFILNRMGTDDYIRPIYPEDDMDIMGDYLMYRYYPKFTQIRTAMGLPYPVPSEQRNALDAEVLRQMTAEEIEQSPRVPGKEWRGAFVTIGLWMFATDAREPLKDVMMRLHLYIKQSKPYPEEYRYGPGRPPPPNPHLRTASRASVSYASDKDDAADTQMPHLRPQQQPVLRSVSRAQLNTTDINTMAPNTSVSEVDKLFAKLMPSVPSRSALAVQAQPTTTSFTSTITLNDLFSTVGVSHAAQQRPPSVSQAPGPAANRGLALLDSIFASASTSMAPSISTSTIGPQYGVPMIPISHSLPSNPEEIQIVSPKPTSSALPQILNQDVISSLLGLGPDSRASSAAPSSSGSRRSGPQRYEGDNEYSESDFASESDYSASSTVLDADADPTNLAAGSSSGLPLLAIQPTAIGTGSGQDSRWVEGDVTPRATVRGIGPLSPPMHPQGSSLRPISQQYLTPAASSAQSATTDGLHNCRNTQSPAAGATGDPAATTTRSRTLVPFEADSDLWPYPRAPLDDRSLEPEDGDVVELDFSDTRALSDPIMFSSRLKDKQSKGASKKKSRKERAADRERERREIEDSWDDPVRGMVTSTLPPSQAEVNGHGKAKQEPVKHSSTASMTNGHVSHGSEDVRAAAARDAIISAVASRPHRPVADIPRNEFVRELLTLIHTDKGFVDKLWQEYVARVH